MLKEHPQSSNDAARGDAVCNIHSYTRKFYSDNLVNKIVTLFKERVIKEILNSGLNAHRLRHQLTF